MKTYKKCLIIAAGRGSRLSKTGLSKPLVALAGLSLIERTIAAAHQTGLSEFCVVTGYESGKVERHLVDLSERRGLSITPVYNPEWETEGNGVSVLAAEGYLAEDFVLLMVDHIFDGQSLRMLMQESPPEGGMVLATDSDIDNETIDAADATKVRVAERRILDIGKESEDHTCYDTGMLLCTPGIFDALRASREGGDTSLSAGIRLLVSERKAGVMDITGGFWMDIDTPADLKRARRNIYDSLSKPLDGWVSRRINRMMSARLLTPVLLKLFPRISANACSLISFVVALAAGVLFLFQRPLVGAILVHMASVLDGSDGEIARLKKMQSPFGKYLDAVLDRYADSVILLCMSVYAFMSTALQVMPTGIASGLLAATAFLAITGNLMVSYTSAKAVADLGYTYRGKVIAAGRGRDFRLFVLFLGGLLSPLYPISIFASLFVVAVLSNAIVIVRVCLSAGHGRRASSLIGRDVRAAIFDLDGTLANTMSAYTKTAVELLVRHYGLDASDAKRRYLDTSGLDFASQVETMFPGHSKNQTVTAAFERVKRDNVQNLVLFTDAIPAFKQLRKKGVQCFVCSSTRQEIVSAYCQTTGLSALAVGCYGLEGGSDKGKQLDRIMAEHGLECREALFVGDSLHDAHLARARGLFFLGVSRIFRKADFLRVGYPSVRDLNGLIRLWNDSMRYRMTLGDD